MLQTLGNLGGLPLSPLSLYPNVRNLQSMQAPLSSQFFGRGSVLKILVTNSYFGRDRPGVTPLPTADRLQG